MDMRDIRQRRELIHQKALQILSITSRYFQDVVIVTRNVMAFQHFRHLPDGLTETRYNFRLMDLQADRDKTQHVITHLFAVQERGVLANVPKLFQPFDPCMRRWW